uniref:EF-hand domain-containing protein n=1 Tax=Chromera velia CCMP2878 TaxID=1169474 RepID=A0A0G4I8N9_9ALVE|eukprot:Cvel_12005.t1-p1 / transcript=Cvel_12005.t1 / gene=Cvel_12005 / organism=Chromera_velia_CCMP2878 / gene_product=Leucine-rich repeat extensin-like protein 5, putative / transcript_product=Leucine-rich repeat extensin-like protein 5, putative / location=Cvel_scaffold770:46600-57280(-) / protein_length=2718 / sequence_SO=supercontig / SO=protein_coding / is_pseudo=false
MDRNKDGLLSKKEFEYGVWAFSGVREKLAENRELQELFWRRADSGQTLLKPSSPIAINKGDAGWPGGKGGGSQVNQNQNPSKRTKGSLLSNSSSASRISGWGQRGAAAAQTDFHRTILLNEGAQEQQMDEEKNLHSVCLEVEALRELSSLLKQAGKERGGPLLETLKRKKKHVENSIESEAAESPSRGKKGERSLKELGVNPLGQFFPSNLTSGSLLTLSPKKKNQRKTPMAQANVETWGATLRALPALSDSPSPSPSPSPGVSPPKSLSVSPQHGGARKRKPSPFVGPRERQRREGKKEEAVILSSVPPTLSPRRAMDKFDGANLIPFPGVDYSSLVKFLDTENKVGGPRQRKQPVVSRNQITTQQPQPVGERERRTSKRASADTVSPRDKMDNQGRVGGGAKLREERDRERMKERERVRGARLSMDEQMLSMAAARRASLQAATIQKHAQGGPSAVETAEKDKTAQGAQRGRTLERAKISETSKRPSKPAAPKNTQEKTSADAKAGRQKQFAPPPRRASFCVELARSKEDPSLIEKRSSLPANLLALIQKRNSKEEDRLDVDKVKEEVRGAGSRVNVDAGEGDEPEGVGVDEEGECDDAVSWHDCPVGVVVDTDTESADAFGGAAGRGMGEAVRVQEQKKKRPDGIVVPPLPQIAASVAAGVILGETPTGHAGRFHAADEFSTSSWKKDGANQLTRANAERELEKEKERREKEKREKERLKRVEKEKDKEKPILSHSKSPPRKKKGGEKQSQVVDQTQLLKEKEKQSKDATSGQNRSEERNAEKQKREGESPSKKKRAGRSRSPLSTDGGEQIEEFASEPEKTGPKRKSSPSKTSHPSPNQTTPGGQMKKGDADEEDPRKIKSQQVSARTAKNPKPGLAVRVIPSDCIASLSVPNLSSTATQEEKEEVFTRVSKKQKDKDREGSIRKVKPTERGSPAVSAFAMQRDVSNAPSPVLPELNNPSPLQPKATKLESNFTLPPAGMSPQRKKLAARAADEDDERPWASDASPASPSKKAKKKKNKTTDGSPLEPVSPSNTKHHSPSPSKKKGKSPSPSKKVSPQSPSPSKKKKKAPKSPPPHIEQDDDDRSPSPSKKRKTKNARKKTDGQESDTPMMVSSTPPFSPKDLPPPAFTFTSKSSKQKAPPAAAAANVSYPPLRTTSKSVFVPEPSAKPQPGEWLRKGSGLSVMKERAESKAKQRETDVQKGKQNQKTEKDVKGKDGAAQQRRRFSSRAASPAPQSPALRAPLPGAGDPEADLPHSSKTTTNSPTRRTDAKDPLAVQEEQKSQLPPPAVNVHCPERGGGETFEAPPTPSEGGKQKGVTSDRSLHTGPTPMRMMLSVESNAPPTSSPPNASPNASPNALRRSKSYSCMDSPDIVGEGKRGETLAARRSKLKAEIAAKRSSLQMTLESFPEKKQKEKKKEGEKHSRTRDPAGPREAPRSTSSSASSSSSSSSGPSDSASASSSSSASSSEDASSSTPSSSSNSSSTDSSNTSSSSDGTSEDAVARAGGWKRGSSINRSLTAPAQSLAFLEMLTSGDGGEEEGGAEDRQMDLEYLALILASEELGIDLETAKQALFGDLSQQEEEEQENPLAEQQSVTQQAGAGRAPGRRNSTISAAEIADHMLALPGVAKGVRFVRPPIKDHFPVRHVPPEIVRMQSVRTDRTEGEDEHVPFRPVVVETPARTDGFAGIIPHAPRETIGGSGQGGARVSQRSSVASMEGRGLVNRTQGSVTTDPRSSLGSQQQQPQQLVGGEGGDLSAMQSERLATTVSVSLSAVSVHSSLSRGKPPDTSSNQQQLTGGRPSRRTSGASQEDCQSSRSRPGGGRGRASIDLPQCGTLNFTFAGESPGVPPNQQESHGGAEGGSQANQRGSGGSHGQNFYSGNGGQEDGGDGEDWRWRHVPVDSDEDDEEDGRQGDKIDGKRVGGSERQAEGGAEGCSVRPSETVIRTERVQDLETGSPPRLTQGKCMIHPGHVRYGDSWSCCGEYASAPGCAEQNSEAQNWELKVNGAPRASGRQSLPGNLHTRPASHLAVHLTGMARRAEGRRVVFFPKDVLGWPRPLAANPQMMRRGRFKYRLPTDFLAWSFATRMAYLKNGNDTMALRIQDLKSRLEDQPAPSRPKSSQTPAIRTSAAASVDSGTDAVSAAGRPPIDWPKGPQPGGEREADRSPTIHTEKDKDPNPPPLRADTEEEREVEVGGGIIRSFSGNSLPAPAAGASRIVTSAAQTVIALPTGVSPDTRTGTAGGLQRPPIDPPGAPGVDVSRCASSVVRLEGHGEEEVEDRPSNEEEDERIESAWPDIFVPLAASTVTSLPHDFFQSFPLTRPHPIFSGSSTINSGPTPPRMLSAVPGSLVPGALPFRVPPLSKTIFSPPRRIIPHYAASAGPAFSFSHIRLTTGPMPTRLSTVHHPMHMGVRPVPLRPFSADPRVPTHHTFVPAPFRGPIVRPPWTHAVPGVPPQGPGIARDYPLRVPLQQHARPAVPGVQAFTPVAFPFPPSLSTTNRSHQTLRTCPSSPQIVTPLGPPRPLSVNPPFLLTPPRRAHAKSTFRPTTPPPLHAPQAALSPFLPNNRPLSPPISPPPPPLVRPPPPGVPHSHLQGASNSPSPPPSLHFTRASPPPLSRIGPYPLGPLSATTTAGRRPAQHPPVSVGPGPAHPPVRPWPNPSRQPQVLGHQPKALAGPQRRVPTGPRAPSLNDGAQIGAPAGLNESEASVGDGCNPCP